MKCMKIFCVEDEPSCIRVLERIALLLGHELVVATNVTDGLALAYQV
jgi:CheY-like chemotaxis protein